MLVFKLAFDFLISIIEEETFEDVEDLDDLGDEVLLCLLEEKFATKDENIIKEELIAFLKKFINVKTHEPALMFALVSNLHIIELS